MSVFIVQAISFELNWQANHLCFIITHRNCIGNSPNASTSSDLSSCTKFFKAAITIISNCWLYCLLFFNQLVWSSDKCLSQVHRGIFMIWKTKRPSMSGMIICIVSILYLTPVAPDQVMSCKYRIFFHMFKGKYSLSVLHSRGKTEQDKIFFWSTALKLGLKWQDVTRWQDITCQKVLCLFLWPPIEPEKSFLKQYVILISKTWPFLTRGQ